jgi:branched-chain amino acid aminotransferase
MAWSDIWLDGELVHADRAQITVLSHAVQRGAAVFDVGRLRLGGGRSLLFRPAEHIARFLRSAELVGLKIQGRWNAETLLAATVQTARASGVTTALVRWSAFVGDVEPDVVPRKGTLASIAIAVLPPEHGAPEKPATIRVMIPRDTRKAGPEVFPPQAKVGASYLGPMLAKRRAQEQGYDEVVLLDADGRVAEAPTANVFVVRNGALVTPPLDRVLAGITRDSVLTLAQREGIEVREAHLSPDDLAKADEAFLVATSLPVQAIASVDGRPLPATAPLTARIKAALLACERGEDPRFDGWVVPVG